MNQGCMSVASSFSVDGPQVGLVPDNDITQRSSLSSTYNRLPCIDRFQPVVLNMLRLLALHATYRNVNLTPGRVRSSVLSL